MEIVNDYVDEEAYFDVYLSDIEISKIALGSSIIKQLYINGVKYNFGVYKSNKEDSDEKERKGKG